jgi:hypothetical protein
MTPKDLPADQRPREKLLSVARRAGRRRTAGAAAAHRPAGARACSQLAQAVLERIGGLGGLLQAGARR